MSLSDFWGDCLKKREGNFNKNDAFYDIFKFAVTDNLHKVHLFKFITSQNRVQPVAILWVVKR